MTTLVINKNERIGFTAPDTVIAECASRLNDLIQVLSHGTNDAKIAGAIALLGDKKANPTLANGKNLYSSPAQKTEYTKAIAAALIGRTDTAPCKVSQTIVDTVVCDGKLMLHTVEGLSASVRDDNGMIMLRTALGHTKPGSKAEGHLIAAMEHCGVKSLTASNWVKVKSAFTQSKNNKLDKAKTETETKTDTLTLAQVMEFLKDTDNMRQAVDAGMLNHLVSAYAKDMGVLQQAMVTAANG